MEKRIVFAHRAEIEESPITIEVIGWEEPNRVGIDVEILDGNENTLSMNTTIYRSWEDIQP